MTVAEAAAPARTPVRIETGVAVLVDGAVDENLQRELDALERACRPVRIVRLSDELRWPDVLASNFIALARRPIQTLLSYASALPHPLAKMRAIHLDSTLSGVPVHGYAGSAGGHIARLLTRPTEEQQAARDQILELDWASLGATALGIQRLHVRPGSVIAELVMWCGAQRSEVVVKIQPPAPDDPRPANESARIEYETLGSLRANMTVQRDDITFSVPRPLLLDEPRFAVVMERAPGTPLDALIRSARRGGDTRTLDEPMRLAGEWLRHMQNATRANTDARALLRTLVAAGEEELASIAAADTEVRAQRERITRHLHALEARVAAAPMIVAGHHEDYWPGNVFIGERSVEVIDFEGSREGFPLEDAVYLISYLELMPFFAAKHRDRLRAAFLEGLLDGAPLDETAYELFHLLNTLRGLSRNVAGDARGFRARHVRRELRRILLRSIS